mgnify:FL=1
MNIPTAVAAKVLHKSTDWVRWGLQQGKLDIIGMAVQTRKKPERWSYHISAKLLAEYTGVSEKELASMVAEYEAKRKGA